MAKSVSQADVVWGYAAQLLNMGAGLMLLPVILRYLPPEDTALWFVFVTLASLSQLLEFGFQPTLTRNAAYIYSGADAISADGLPHEVTHPGRVNQQLLSDLIATSRSIYRAIAALAGVVLLGGGTWYISTLLTPQQNHAQALSGWFAFALGYVGNFYFGYFGGLLQGRGDVRLASKIAVYSRGSLVLIGTISVLCGFGLLGLGLSSLVATAIGRILAMKYFETNEERARASEFPPSGTASELVSVLWSNARRLGAVHLGAFLIQRGNILVGTTLLGLNAVASYSLTVTLMMALVNGGMVVCNVNMPYMSSLQITKDVERLKDAYATSLAAAMLVFIFGGVFLLFAGNWILTFVEAKTVLVAPAVLAVMLVAYLLELHHSVAANYITTSNSIPFVKAALLSGGAILLLAAALASQLGVWALVGSQALVQLSYNNWKWPLVVTQSLQSSVVQILTRGIELIFRRKHVA